MSEGNSVFNKTKRIIKNSKGMIFTVVILVTVVLLFMSAVDGAAVKADSSAAATLEKAIRRAAVQCFAIEGFYPPEVDYLVENYGVIIDYDKYAVKYKASMSNVMPDIRIAIAGQDYIDFNVDFNGE